MKIFFGYTSANLAQNKNNCVAIREYLLKQHLLTRDWFNQGIDFLKHKSTSSQEKGVLKKVITAISNAQTVIIEGSFGGFAIVHQTAVALQLGKPTLFLVKKRYFRPETEVGQEYITHIIKNQKNLLKLSLYKTLKEVKQIIDNFIQGYKDNLQKSKRFNFVLSQELDNYLSWKAYKSKQTKAQVMRAILTKQQKKDKKQIKKDLIGSTLPVNFNL